MKDGAACNCEEGQGVLSSPEEQREESEGPHAPPVFQNKESSPVFFQVSMPPDSKKVY